jgi:hypothetical protein
LKQEIRSQLVDFRFQIADLGFKKAENRYSTVGAAFPALPVPGVVPGSLPALSSSNGSKGSRDSSDF